MRQSTKKRLLALALALWIGYTILFSVLKMPEDRRIDRWHLDVVFHFTSYLVMVVLGASLLRFWVLAPAFLVAAGTELVQGRLPHRTASWGDFGIDLAGIALGLAVWLVVTRLRQRRLRAKTD